MALIQTLISFVLALGILVTIHEFGHFWVARRCGIKVLRFSVGFGKPIYSWYDKQGTEFALAAIPLGGYVKMLDEREGEVPAHLLDQAFTRKSVWARIAVVAAGPIANFLLAIVLFWAMVMPGIVQLVPMVGEVTDGSIAAAAGIETGQEIVAIDGKTTDSWQAVHQRLLERLGETGVIAFTVRYPNSTLTYESEAHLEQWLVGEEEPDVFEGIGIKPLRTALKPLIDIVVADSPAESAGLKTGDLILATDGQLIETWAELVAYIEPRHDQAIELTLERGVELLTLWVTPEKSVLEGRTIGRIGVSPQQPHLRRQQFTLLEGLVVGVEKTWETSGFVLLSLKKLLVGEISTKNLSGPITIAKVAGDSARAGWEFYIGFLALLSVSLGVFNLLPIPVLDGGHLLYYLVELVKGSPVSEKIQMAGYQVGLLVVLSVMVLAFYNDIMRLY